MKYLIQAIGILTPFDTYITIKGGTKYNLNESKAWRVSKVIILFIGISFLTTIFKHDNWLKTFLIDFANTYILLSIASYVVVLIRMYKGN